MSPYASAGSLIAQLDRAEARIARNEAWERKARRYLFVKLPIVGVALYGGSRLDMLQVVIPLMLFAGTVTYLVPWLTVLGLKRERDALLAQIDGPNVEKLSGEQTRARR